MSVYINNNYILEEENKYIIFNVPTSRLFTIQNREQNLGQVIDSINSKCTESEYIKNIELPKRDKLLQLVISCAETCNLSCKYCFANAGTYNRDEKKKILDEEGYETLLEKLMELDHPIRSVCFFGGEPLLGFDYLEKFVENLIAGYKSRDWRIPDFGIVTNGTLINERIAAFFNKYNVDVSISIDGPKEVNDKNRYYSDRNKSVHDMIANNMKYMKNRDYHVSATATISRTGLQEYNPGDFEKTMNHFIEMGFDYMQVQIADFKESLTKEDKEKIELFVKEEADYVFENVIAGTNLLSIPRTPLGIICSIAKRKYSVECPAGKILKYYTVNGEFYPCQLYFASDRANAELLSRTNNDKCKDCFCVNICSQYCPGGSVWANGDENSVIEVRCYYQKKITEEVLKRMNELINNKSFVERILEISRQYKKLDEHIIL